MGRPIGPKRVYRYSAEFKLTAVKLSGMPGVQVQTVATALDIHPFMLSRWRKEARDGVLRGRSPTGRGRAPARAQAAAGARARARDTARGACDLLKKAIRFCSGRRRRSSRSLTAIAGAAR